MRRQRVIDPVRPACAGRHDGIAYTLWRPEHAPRAGVVVVHGAGSQKENQYDFARAAVALGLAVLTFDQRGHGETAGALDGRALTDVASMADLLRASLTPPGRLALRGSSLGGYLVIRAARLARAEAVVAICPASAAGLRRGLDEQRFALEADAPALHALLDAEQLSDSVAALTVPLLIMHARGDERVPVEHSRELAGHFATADSRLIEVPGGHHQSVQHDEELQAVSLRFVARALGVGPAGATP